MQSADAHQPGQGEPGGPDGENPYPYGEALLGRVRAVARRITERVRRVAGDTREGSECPDPADEQRPPGFAV